MKYPKGSEWRKWDLHFHTPSSYDYINKAITDEDIIKELLKAEIAAVAITDHHIIDTQRIKNLQELAGNKLTIFPGIEFRSELGGSNSVHFIGIFPEDCDIEYIWIKLQGTSSISRKDIETIGADAVYVDFKDTAKVIHDNGGLVTVHAGRKCNSIEGITNVEKASQALKKDLARDYIDFYEIGNIEKDVEEYRGIVFPTIGKKLPLIICSDNHDINSYRFKMPCWIKADPTFKGLRQILNEPEGRVHIGELPHKIENVWRNKIKYIDHLRIEKANQSDFQEVWFDNDIYLNHGLVAIIGNKGSGKSALADIIGLAAETKIGDNFSFLNKNKFKQEKNNKARHFNAKIVWRSQEENTVNLDKTVKKEAVERARYIPQNFLETVCNELSKEQVGKKGDFEKTLEEVIFSHIDEAEQQGKATLDDLIAYKTNECRNSIEHYKFIISERNKKIVLLEGLMRKEYKESIRNKILVKRNEIVEHDKNKPNVVEKDSVKIKTDDPINVRIEELKLEIEELEKNIEDATRRKAELVKEITKAEELLKKIENFGEIYSRFKVEAESICKDIDIFVDDLVTYTVNIAPLESRKEALNNELSNIKEKLDGDSNESIVSKKAVLVKELKELQARLDEPNKKYQKYLEEQKVWERTKKALEGTVEQIDSLKYVEHSLKEANDASELIKEVERERLEALESIYKELTEIKSIFEKYYAPVQSFIEKSIEEGNFLSEGNLVMNFDASIVENNFSKSFFEYINRKSKSAFYGIEESYKKLTELVKQYDFNVLKDVKSFIAKILELLTNDKEKGSLEISNQLRQEKTLESFYNFLFSLDYLRPKYSLTWDKKSVDELSPGEKGTLLLIFYLLIDKQDIPLIIDQPEENLDNETIYKVLVPCIKAAKERRQVILVTHNPNLAVVCDAEQVICSSIDKKNDFRVSYNTGSIENPDINKKILDILEGTRPAFDNRDSKYLPEI